MNFFSAIFSAVNSVFSFFCWLGFCIGLWISGWTLYFCLTHQNEIVNWHATHPTSVQGLPAYHVKMSTTWEENKLDYADFFWYLTIPWKIAYLTIGCQVIGILFSSLLFHIFVRMLIKPFTG